MLLWSLKRKYKYFQKHNKLSLDRSFYYDDDRLLNELGFSLSTVRRSKRKLMARGDIKFIAGRYVGTATKYWILYKDKEDIKMTSSNLVQEGSKMIPSHQNKEGVKMTKEGSNLTKRGCQNDSLGITNVITNDITKAGSASACHGQALPDPSFKPEYIIPKKITYVLLDFWREMKLDEMEMRKCLSNKDCSKEEIDRCLTYVKEGVELVNESNNTDKGDPAQVPGMSE